MSRRSRKNRKSRKKKQETTKEVKEPVTVETPPVIDKLSAVSEIAEGDTVAVISNPTENATTVDNSNNEDVTTVLLEEQITVTPNHTRASRLHNIIANLMEQWNNSVKETQMVRNQITTLRSLNLVIRKDSGNDDLLAFGALLDRGKVYPYTPPDGNFTTTCTMNEDTFLDALLGKDKYNRPFNISYAWSCGEIQFTGTDWFVHQAALKEMFKHFAHILKIRRRR